MGAKCPKCKGDMTEVEAKVINKRGADRPQFPTGHQRAWVCEQPDCNALPQDTLREFRAGGP